MKLASFKVTNMIEKAYNHTVHVQRWFFISIQHTVGVLYTDEAWSSARRVFDLLISKSTTQQKLLSF